MSKSSMRYLLLLLLFISIECYGNKDTTHENDVIEYRINTIESRLNNLDQAIDSKLNDSIKMLSLEKDLIDYRKDQVSWWLGVLGLFLAILGVLIPIFAIKLSRDIKEQKDKAIKEIEDLQERANKCISKLEANLEHVDNQKSMLDEKTRTAYHKVDEIADLHEKIKANLASAKYIYSSDEIKVEAISTSDDDTVYISILAEANNFFSKNNFIEAKKKYIELFKCSVDKINKKDIANAYFRLGYCHSVDKDYELAITMYTNAITVSKDFFIDNIGEDFTYSYTNRSAAYLDIGEFDNARKDVDFAVKINPDDHVAHYNSGLLLIQDEQYLKALTNLNKSIELLPTYSDAYKAIGDIYHKSENYIVAIEKYDRAIMFNKKKYSYYSARGNSKSCLKLYEEALVDLDKSIVLEPNDNAFAYRLRGYVNSILGKTVEAVLDYEKSIEIDGTDVYSLSNCAELYTVNGRYIDSKKLIDKLFSMSIEDENTMFGVHLIDSINKYLMNELFDNPETVSNKLKKMCLNPNKIGWSFNEMILWVNDIKSTLSDKQREYLKKLISQFDTRTIT